MAEKTSSLDWKTPLTDSYQLFFNQFVDHLPEIIIAIVLVIVGWILARLLSVLASKLILALEDLLPKTTKMLELEKSSLASYARFGKHIVFWGILSVFIIGAIHSLKWSIFSDISAVLLSYIPNLLTGLLIILVGFTLSGLIKSAFDRAGFATAAGQSSLLPQMAQATIIITSIVIGIEHLGINVAFFTNILTVVIGVTLSGAALAFGLGARQFVANVIGAHTARKQYELGQQIQVGDLSGPLLEITRTAIIINTVKGRATVPANLVQTQIVEVINDKDNVSSSAVHNSGKI